jgi:predicted cobalt transporter CbtA
LAIVAVILIVLPHLYGAPQAFDHSTAALEALNHRFVVATTVVNFLFWIILGASTAHFYGRRQPRIGFDARAAA